jgi:bacterioferritin
LLRRKKTLYIRDKNAKLLNIKGDFLATKEMVELLNKGLAHQLQASVQYMWEHILARGIEGAVVENAFRNAAIVEMKHAEDLADRIVFLNGLPTNNPSPIHVGHSLEEMLKENVQAEEEAISVFKEAIQMASKEGDYGTRRLLEEILCDEERHLGKFGKLLVGMTSPFTQPQL